MAVSFEDVPGELEQRLHSGEFCEHRLQHGSIQQGMRRGSLDITTSKGGLVWNQVRASLHQDEELMRLVPSASERLGDKRPFEFADRIGDIRTVNDVLVTAKTIIEQTKAA